MLGIHILDEKAKPYIEKYANKKKYLQQLLMILWQKYFNIVPWCAMVQNFPLPYTRNPQKGIGKKIHTQTKIKKKHSKYASFL